MSAPEPIKLDRDLVVLDTIARSPQSETYRGRLFGSAGFSSLVAVKRLHPILFKDEAAMDALGTRSTALGRIAHPNVVNLKSVREIDGVLHLLFSYVSCVNLDTLMQHLRRGGHRVGAPVACFVARQITRGLAAAQSAPHELVHGEVTPPAVLLGFDGAIQVCDFGLTKGASHLHRTQLTLTAGFGDYLAPEREEGAEPTAAGDNYGVGMILYEMLTGRRAEPGADFVPPSKVNVTVPKALDDVVAAALARDPAARPSNAAILEGRLAPFTSDDQTEVLASMAKTVCADVYAKELVAMERMWSLDQPEERELNPPAPRQPSGANDWRLHTPTLLDVLPDAEDEDEPRLVAVRSDSRDPTLTDSTSASLLEADTVAVSAPEFDETIEDDPRATVLDPPAVKTIPIEIPAPKSDPVVVPDAVVSPVAAATPPSWERPLVRVLQVVCVLGLVAIGAILFLRPRTTLDIQVRGAGSSVAIDGTHTTRSGLRMEGAAAGLHTLVIKHDSGDAMTVGVDVAAPEHVVVVIDD